MHMEILPYFLSYQVSFPVSWMLVEDMETPGSKTKDITYTHSYSLGIIIFVCVSYLSRKSYGGDMRRLRLPAHVADYTAGEES